MRGKAAKRIPSISALPWNAARTERLQRSRQLPSVAPRGTCQQRLFSSTAILRLQPLFSLPTNLHFLSNTGTLSKIRPSLSPPLGGRVQRNPSATRLFPVGFYFPSVLSRLFLRPGTDVPALGEGRGAPGAGGAGAYANTRGRNPRLPPGRAGPGRDCTGPAGAQPGAGSAGCPRCRPRRCLEAAGAAGRGNHVGHPGSAT